jgi:hypothetical protein
VLKTGSTPTTAVTIGTDQSVTFAKPPAATGAGSISTNTAFGTNALSGGSQSGIQITAIGVNALALNTSGNYGVAVGFDALAANTSGANNTALGRRALYNNTTGSDNQAVGFNALFTNTTGASNTAIGSNALTSNTTASQNTAVGHQSLFTNSSGANNTATGYVSLYLNTTGSRNAAFGVGALYSNTTGTSNVGVSINALNGNTTGSNNVAVGDSALQSSTTANNNTAVGFQAGYTNSTGAESTYLGRQAGYLSTGNYNTFVGSQSGYNSTGSQNTFVGGSNASTGSAGQAMTTGSRNTILGNFDGNQGGLDIRTANNYIVLADGAGNPRGFFDNNGTFYVGNTNGLNWTTATNGGAATITLGFYYSRATGSTSGRYWFSGADNGNSYIVYNQNNTGVYISNGATSWTANSDERLKDIIEPITDAANKVSSMRSVIGKYKSDEEGTRRSFLIAQDVQAVLPEAISTHKIQGDDTDYLGVSYTDVIPLLVAAIKELKAEIDTLKG